MLHLKFDSIVLLYTRLCCQILKKKKSKLITANFILVRKSGYVTFSFKFSKKKLLEIQFLFCLLAIVP